MTSGVRTSNVQTKSGTIAYAEQGEGPVALFVHGVVLNKYLWRRQLASLGDIRRCVAPDLLAHGDTEIAPTQDVSVSANAEMLREFLDALAVDKADIVANDSGGGIAQIFAANYPERVRTLTLTNCDTHDNWPPAPFQPFLAMAAAGGLKDTLSAMVDDKAVFRSPETLGPCYENPRSVSDETIDIYLKPFLRSPQRLKDFERFLAAFDNVHTTRIEAKLRKLEAPTQIVWGTDDIYFPVEWADWLTEAIPGVTRQVRFRGAHIFFPEERADAFNRELRSHWAATS